MKTHWNNPWSDAVTVPIEELAECCSSLGQTCTDVDGTTFVWTIDKILKYWTQSGDKVDAYILPNRVEHCMGIRYGNKGSHYISPMGNQEKLSALLKKYSHLK